MPRQSYTEQVQIVKDAVQAAGGTTTHNELVDALVNSGHQHVVYNIHRIARSGEIVPSVRAFGSDRPVLSYSLPGYVAPPTPQVSPTPHTPPAPVG